MQKKEMSFIKGQVLTPIWGGMREHLLSDSIYMRLSFILVDSYIINYKD